MRLINDVFERLPQVWLLLGLLFFSAGLYLGFDYRVSFVYFGIGIVCALYGVVLFAFLLREKPARSNPRPLSRNFISAGSTVVMPAPDPGEQVEERVASQRTMQASAS